MLRLIHLALCQRRPRKSEHPSQCHHQRNIQILKSPTTRGNGILIKKIRNKRNNRAVQAASSSSPTLTPAAAAKRITAVEKRESGHLPTNKLTNHETNRVNLKQKLHQNLLNLRSFNHPIQANYQCQHFHLIEAQYIENPFTSPLFPFLLFACDGTIILYIQ